MRKIELELIAPLVFLLFISFSSASLAKSTCWTGHTNWVMVGRQSIDKNLERIKSIRPDGIESEAAIDETAAFLTQRVSFLSEVQLSLGREYKKGCDGYTDSLYNGKRPDVYKFPSEYPTLSDAIEGALKVSSLKIDALHLQKIVIQEGKVESSEKKRLEQIAEKFEKNERRKRIKERAKKSRAASVAALELPSDVTDAELHRAIQARRSAQIQDRLNKMIDRSILSEEEKFFVLNDEFTLQEVEKRVKERWFDKNDIFATKNETFDRRQPIYTVSQPISNGYMLTGYRDTIPVILITNKTGLEGDGIEDVTLIVSYVGVQPYTTVTGAKRQAIVLQDVWNGKSRYEITRELNRGTE